MTDTQISVGMNVDGVVTGTEKAKRKISELGAAAREAGKGTGAIGDGMAGSAQKVEAATKNMVGSIQRQIAALEAGDKSSRQYQESLARMRGIDTAALKPYLDQLDAAKLKQSEAAKSAESLAGSMGSIRIAAVAIGASLGALAMFSKNIIDAADGLNDLSQRVGISVRELGKYQLAAEQSGTSLESISKGVKGLAKSMVENGDALRKAGIDATSADGAMQQLADVFSEMPDGIEKTTLATKLFGKAGMDLIPMLNLGSEGLRDAALASAEYAEQMAIMAPLADSLNDKMAVVALSSKTAGAIMVNEFLPSLDKIAQAFVDSKDGANSFAGVLGSVVNSTVQVAALLISDVVFVLKATGREIGAIAAQAVALASLDFKGFSAISDAVKDDAARARVELDKFQDNLVNGTVNIQAAYNKRQGTGEVLKDGARGSNLLRSLGGDGEAKKALAEANRELEEQNRLIAENAGLTASFAKDWGMLSKMFLLGKLSLDQLTDAQSKLLAKQPAIKASIDAQKRAIEESSKMYSSAAIADRKYYEELENNSDKLEATNKKLAEENELIGLSEKAKEGLVLSRLDNAIAIEKEAFALLNLQNSSEIEIATAQKRILLMQEQRNLTGNGYVAKEASAAADAWKKAAESIRDSLTDAFMQAIDGTKSLWVSLRDSVVGMFKNMVLRPILQGVLQPVATALTGSLIGNAANAATGASATSGVLSSVTGIGASAGAGSISSLLGSSSMGALDLMGFDPTTIGIALGVAFLSSLGGKFISATDSGRARVDYNAAGVGGSAYSTTGDAAQIAAATKNTNTLAKSYYDTAKSLGITAMQAAFEVGTNTGREGANPQTVLGVNIGKVGYSSGEISSGDSAGLQLAASRAVLTALQASELPSYLAGVFDDITVSTATQEQITTALTSAGALATFNKELQALPFSNLADLSYSATQSLIKFSGGLDTLKTNLGTYYSNFYTSEEQRAQTIANINKATFGSGLDAANATRDSFRAIVEAQDLSTESGRAMYAALISVSGAFAGLTPVLDSVAATVTTTVDALQVAMARAQNANALADSAMAALTASIDAEKLSLSSKYEADLSALTTAQDAYTQSVTDSISSISASVGALQSLSNRLKSSLANPLAGTEGQQRQSAQALIASVLAVAKSGGGLPKDTTALESALSTVAKPSEKLFGSFEDYARDFYKTSNDIAALSGITDTTLTAQQAMLAQLEAQSAISKAAYSSQAKLLKDQYDQAVKGLDTTLASAQKQLDALHGIDTSVLSVSAAIDRLAAALGIAKTTQTTSNAVTDDTIRGYIANLKTGGGTEADMVITLAKRAKEVGVTQADIARAMSMTEADVASYFASFGIPKFAQGTNYVPSDMVAMVHEGEAIIPKAYNPSAANTGNSDTAAALRALADRLDRIEANTRATAGHTAGTDRKLARVIPGNALITEAAV